MMVAQRSFIRGGLVLILLLALTAVATASDGITIQPGASALTLKEGDLFSEAYTVTVPEGATISRADVYLLADTTGSMFSIIDAVKSGASAVVDGLVAALPGVDLNFGVGNYKDFPFDPYAFDHQLSLTADTTAAKSEILNWFSGGGVDGSEGQLFALDRLAAGIDPAGGTIGWRPDALKIIVWFGDAPGHDPVCAAISGLSYDITEETVTADLTAGEYRLLAISTITGFADGLDDNPTLSAGDYSAICGTLGGSFGQASRITAATGGTHVTGIDATTIVDTIVNLVMGAVSVINNLDLEPTGATAPFVTAINPSGGYGPLELNVTHVLPFDVTFTGVMPCLSTEQMFAGTLDVVADGSVEAAATVHITVPACFVDGRMTGGGHVTAGGSRVSHGFTLQCDAGRGPNSLQVNWGRGDKFHLESLTSAACSDDPLIAPDPPPAAFDTYSGSGTGRFNGAPGATATWTFTDAGQPGRLDRMQIDIWDAAGEHVLSVSGNLGGGNHQAHDQ